MPNLPGKTQKASKSIGKGEAKKERIKKSSGKDEAKTLKPARSKQASISRTKFQKAKSDQKPRKLQRLKSDDNDEEVVAGVTDPDESFDDDDENEKVAEVKEVTMAVPFSDGIVAGCLKDLVIVPRVGGPEVTLFKEFLNYYASTESYIGTVSNKLSFMRKKGGLLL